MTIEQEYSEALKELNRAWLIFNNEGSLSSIYNLKSAELRVSELKAQLHDSSSLSHAKNVSGSIIPEIFKYFNIGGNDDARIG